MNKYPAFRSSFLAKKRYSRRESFFWGGGGLCSALLMNPAFAIARKARKPVAAKAAPLEIPAPEMDGNRLAEGIPTLARWAYAVDIGTGATLIDKNADQKMAPSSLTKMMTAYIVFLMLASSRLRLDQTLPVSEKAWRMGGSRMFVKLGSQVPVSDLIQGMLIQSGNDSCVVLAEGIAGSEENFAALMNQQARQFGLRNSHFMNATGWPHPDHYMSARDIGTVAVRLIRDFPQYYHYFGEKSFTYNHITQENRNRLVVQGLADGLKTGHTDAGGYGLCASAPVQGSRVVVVVNGLNSERARVTEAARLLQWSKSQMAERPLVIKDSIIVPGVPVWMGGQGKVALLAGQGLTLSLPENLMKNVRLKALHPSLLKAPVLQGQAVGRLIVEVPGLPLRSVPLVAQKNVSALGMWERALRRLERHPQ